MDQNYLEIFHHVFIDWNDAWIEGDSNGVMMTSIYMLLGTILLISVHLEIIFHKEKVML